MTQVEILPSDRIQASWLPNSQIQPIRRVDVRNLRGAVVQQPTVQVIDLNHNDNHLGHGDLNNIRVINNPNLVRQILSGRSTTHNNNNNQPSIVRIPFREHSVSTERRGQNTYLIVDPTPRPSPRIAVVNRIRPASVVAVHSAVPSSSGHHDTAHAPRSSTGAGSRTIPRASSAGAAHESKSIARASSAGHAHGSSANTGISSAGVAPVERLPITGVGPVQQPAGSAHSVGNIAVITSSNQNSNSAIPSKSSSAAQPHTHDPLFEELVIAFEEALRNPKAQASTVGHNPPAVGHGHIHGASNPGYYQSQTPMSQFNMGHGHMFGDPFGFVSPWMMDPATQQEMMFGDTTDPPVPPAPETTPAPRPATSAAAAPGATVAVTVSPVVLPAKPTIPVEVSSPAPRVIVETTSIPAEVPIPTTTAATAVVSVEQTFAPETISTTTVKAEQTTAPTMTTAASLVPVDPSLVPDLQNISSKKGFEAPPETLLKSPTVTENATAKVEPSVLQQVQGMLNDSKLDTKVIEAAIRQAIKVLRVVPPELAVVANQMGIVLDKHIEANPTSAPVHMETLPTMEQLGVTIPEPGKAAKRDSIQKLKGATRGIVVYPPPTAPSGTNKTQSIVPKNIKIIVIEPTNFPRNNSSKFSPGPLVTATFPTLPPEAAIPGKRQPEIYQALQTAHGPGPISVVKSSKSKLSVKSLVDSTADQNLSNLEAILMDISNQSKVPENQNVNKNSLKQKVSYTPSASTRVETSPAQTTPNTVLINRQINELNKFDHQNIRSTSNSPVLNTNKTGIMTGKGLPVKSSVIEKTKPSLANVEGVPVSMQKIPSEGLGFGAGYDIGYVVPTYASSVRRNDKNKVLDSTGAMTILQEIRTLKQFALDKPGLDSVKNLQNTFKSNKNFDLVKHLSGSMQGSVNSNELANKLRDPRFMGALQMFLKSFGQTTKMASIATSIPQYFYDVTTTSSPRLSTEEYEIEDFITRRQRLAKGKKLPAHRSHTSKRVG